MDNSFYLSRRVLDFCLVLSVILAISMPLVFYLNINSTKIESISDVTFSSEKIKYYVDRCSLESGKLVISGWGFIVGERSGGPMKVLFKDANGDYEKINSRVSNRADVDQVFDIKYPMNMAGFSAASSNNLLKNVKFPLEITLVKMDVNGINYGGNYVCK